MNHHVRCYHHFGYDELPFPIKDAEYREQFSQLKRFVSAFFRRLIGIGEVSGVKALEDDLFDFVRSFFQETRNLFRVSVCHLHDLSLRIK